MAYTLFQDPAALAQICEKIIAPNLTLRKSDEEEFEDDPMAYVRKDIEGSDSGTRRRSAYALIKGLRRNFEETITRIFQGYIESLLQNGKWAAKDSAIYLVMALATKKYSQAKGVVELNPLINVDSFYRTYVLPELQGNKTDSLLLKASCLTFVNTFRRQFTDDDFKVGQAGLVTLFTSPDADADFNRLLVIEVRRSQILCRFLHREIPVCATRCSWPI